MVEGGSSSATPAGAAAAWPGPPAAGCCGVRDGVLRSQIGPVGSAGGEVSGSCMVVAPSPLRKCLCRWVCRPAALAGLPAFVRRRGGAEEDLLRAKVDGAASADVAILVGVVMDLFDLLSSWVTSSGQGLDLAVHGRTTTSILRRLPS